MGTLDGEGGGGEDGRRAVSHVNGGREGRAAVLYIPLSLQAAELGSAGHASPPAWSLPIVGSVLFGAARTGEGMRTQEERHRGERCNHSSRQEQRESYISLYI